MLKIPGQVTTLMGKSYVEGVVLFLVASSPSRRLPPWITSWSQLESVLTCCGHWSDSNLRNLS